MGSYPGLFCHIQCNSDIIVKLPHPSGRSQTSHEIYQKYIPDLPTLVNGFETMLLFKMGFWMGSFWAGELLDGEFLGRRAFGKGAFGWGAFGLGVLLRLGSF